MNLNESLIFLTVHPPLFLIWLARVRPMTKEGFLYERGLSHLGRERIVTVETFCALVDKRDFVAIATTFSALNETVVRPRQPPK